MPLPAALRDAIAAETRSVPGGELARAAQQLSAGYRKGDFAAPLGSAAARAAYLSVRLPATFAATAEVLRRVREVAPSLQVASVLDLGAGPGAAAWAACEVFPGVSGITLVERDPALVALGRRLAAASSCAALREASWKQADLERQPAFALHDLIVLSYALGELRPAAATALVSAAWNATRVALVIVEPGTPRNFACVLDVRSALIAAGARLAAPCPHHLTCPLAGAGDWCHFAVRVQRSAEHRRAKAAELAYEDEKFSYVAAVRATVHLPAARIVRHPQFRTGHVQLTLCTAEGVQQPTIGRAQKELYRSARHASWGDCWR